MVRLKSVFGKYINVRKEKRNHPQPGVECFVTSKDDGSSRKVQLLNLSLNGLAFSCKGDFYEVGHRIEIQVAYPNGMEVLYEGEVLSQHIFYPKHTQELKHALFRFSAKIEPVVQRADLSAVG